MKKGTNEMLTAKKFAERAKISYTTVMAWLRAGRIPGAKLMENTALGTYWEIPATSIDKVNRPRRGRKPSKKREGN